MPIDPNLEHWLSTRPESVQKLAREFPLCSRVSMPSGERWWLVGWTESDAVLVSPISPMEDYDASIEARQRLCASHLRDASS
jgi:hypothetical protein